MCAWLIFRERVGQDQGIFAVARHWLEHDPPFALAADQGLLTVGLEPFRQTLLLGGSTFLDPHLWQRDYKGSLGAEDGADSALSRPLSETY